MSESDAMLVIDDDNVLRQRLVKAFRSRSIVTYEAHNSLEAIECVKSYKPKMVILDLKLGNESGITLLDSLLKIDSSLKIIVLTGFGTISSAVNAVKLGAINFLTKPIDADSILSAFKQKNIENETQIQTPHLAQVEWEHIQRVMQEHDGNISKASKALGLHRRSLQRKLGKNPFKIS